MPFWLKLVRKCDLEEQQRVTQESPLGHGHGEPVHITSTHHHMLLLLQLQNRKVSTFFSTFGGKYERTVLQNHNIAFSQFSAMPESKLIACQNSLEKPLK